MLRRRGSFCLHVDATAIWFSGQIDAKSKIALQGNGTHSSILRKRSIARQVIGVVKNGAREREQERERERERGGETYESIQLQ